VATRKGSCGARVGESNCRKGFPKWMARLSQGRGFFANHLELCSSLASQVSIHQNICSPMCCREGSPVVLDEGYKTLKRDGVQGMEVGKRY